MPSLDDTLGQRLKGVGLDRLTVLNLDMRKGGLEGMRNGLLVLTALGRYLRALRLNMDRLPATEEDVQAWFDTTGISLRCLQAFKCHLGRDRWSQTILACILAACDSETLSCLSLTYPRRISSISPLPKDVLYSHGRGLRKLDLYLTEPLMAPSDVLQQGSNFEISNKSLTELCPLLHTISLNRVDLKSACYIAANLEVLRLNCADTTTGQLEMIALSLAGPSKLERLYLHGYEEAGSSTRDEVQKMLARVGWVYVGLSICQETMLFVKSTGRI